MTTATISLNFPELKEVRVKNGQSQEEMGKVLNYSRQMIQKIENGKGKIQSEDAVKLARAVNESELYLTLANKVTGGVMTAPYLNNIDDHRLVMVMKLLEEVEEAMGSLKGIIPIVIKAQDRDSLKDGEGLRVEATLLEVVEAITAAENTLGRLAKVYDISLADLWDKHQIELVQKGYIKKEKSRL